MLASRGEGKGDGRTFSDINKLLLNSLIAEGREKKDLVKQNDDPSEYFKNITQCLLTKITEKAKVVKKDKLALKAQGVRSKVNLYFNSVDTFMEEWESIGVIQPIYSELVEIGKLATISFIDCAAIVDDEAEGKLSNNITSLLGTAQNLLTNFNEEHLILVLTNYFQMKENLDALRQTAETEGGYTEKEKQKCLFLWGVFYAVMGVIIILLSAIVISFFVSCGGSLPFLTYFYTCLSGSVSTATITSVSIATKIVGITASCYSCAVTMGPFFGFLMYRLIEWRWKPTEFQEAIKVLVREIERFLKKLNKDFVEFQQSSDASLNVKYLSREDYIAKIAKTKEKKVTVTPQSTMLVLLQGLGHQSSETITDMKEAFRNTIKSKLNVPNNQTTSLNCQLDALFSEVQVCTNSIDKFEQDWPIDGSSEIRLYLADIVQYVVSSYAANFKANFGIKDTLKQDALTGILEKTAELLTALDNDDIVIILAKYFEMKRYLDELKRYAETDAGWSEEKRQGALYLCCVVTALISVVAVFLLATAFYFWLHLGGVFYFGHFLINCLKGASAVAAGCYSFASIVGPAVSYLFYGRIIDKVIPKSPLQLAIAGITRGTDSFIKALGDYSKTSGAKKIIRKNMLTINEQKTGSFATPSPPSKQESSQLTPYFSRRQYIQRTAEKERAAIPEFSSDDLSCVALQFPSSKRKS